MISWKKYHILWFVAEVKVVANSNVQQKEFLLRETCSVLMSWSVWIIWVWIH